MSDDPFPTLQALRDRPIPDQAPVLARREGYRGHPLDAAGEAGGEPLVLAERFDLRGSNYYHDPRNPPYYRRIEGSVPYIAVREGVAHRLAAVQRRLLADGLRLWLFDGWRPDAVQRYFYDRWLPEEAGRRGGGAATLAELRGYWSRPTSDPMSPAPHLTGGAVDLTLCWEGGDERLWMGSLFDDVTPVAHLDRFEALGPGCSYSDAEARANRRLLYWVMVDAGFCPNPYEWWHFSYGDQMWARVTGAAAALYGEAPPLTG